MRGLPTFDDPNLLVGAEGFSDAGVYRLRDDLCIVQSLDFFPPLVDDPFTFGQIAAANALSDLYAMGARPTTALNIVGFPDDQLELTILSEILCGGADRVREAGAVIVGGHTVRDTEIKYGLSVTGVVEPDRLLTNQKAQAGDALVLTKPLGTGFVTTAYKARRCPADTLDVAVQSMIQLNRLASEAAVARGAHAVTDITGFGLAGHAGEMAQASRVTLSLDVDRLPILPGAAELAERGHQTRASATNRSFAESMMRIEGHPDRLRMKFLFDPQTSGGLLITIATDQADQLVSQLNADNTHVACRIGTVRERQQVSLIFCAAS